MSSSNLILLDLLPIDRTTSGGLVEEVPSISGGFNSGVSGEVSTPVLPDHAGVDPGLTHTRRQAHDRGRSFVGNIVRLPTGPRSPPKTARQPLMDGDTKSDYCVR